MSRATPSAGRSSKADRLDVDAGTEKLRASSEAQGPHPVEDPARDLRANDMMAHLMDALDAGQDIGHYGRLVFAMVAHHFMEADDVARWLTKDKSIDAHQAKLLVAQVKAKDYNPPKAQKIQQFQEQQSFPICPNGTDPDGCNVYKNLKFPDGVYEHIQEYYEQKVGS
jgi:hypothetical protein